MKKTLTIWIIIVVLLSIGLTLIGYNITKENKKYKVLEKELVKVAEGYFGEKINLLQNNAVVLDTELKEYNPKIDMKIDGKECKGYVKTTSKMGIYEYKAYIKCDDYETNGYVSQTNICTEGC